MTLYRNAGSLLSLCAALLPALSGAAPSTIPGPAGSSAFGQKVALVQTGGNFAVVDPAAGGGAGAVYLYTAAGALLSTLSGSAAGDHVGSGGVVVLADGKFLVASPAWSNGGAAAAGAVTLVDGTTGLNAAVSEANSLVGSAANDAVGNRGVTLLTNGAFVVSSDGWSGGRGAVTRGDGAAGLHGAVSAANSLVGSQGGDAVGGGFEFVSPIGFGQPPQKVNVGGVTALANGNYVVGSPHWGNGAAAQAGAATWCSGTAPCVGAVSSSNSLVGDSANDYVGDGVAALSNGNYVVRSPRWANGSATFAGAATWCNGAAACVGTVSNANSLVGSSANDGVGGGVTALSNGNYVVISDSANAGTSMIGAATWGDGSKGIVGTISAQNSLIGLHDPSGGARAVALSNGNYVVSSPYWNNNAGGGVGAVTWGDGTRGVTGLISSQNSFLGARDGDQLGSSGVIALKNGNYVISTVTYSNGTAPAVGAVTWADGSKPLLGTVSAANSLTGDAAEDSVGGVTVLSSGNYVVSSSSWHGFRGAVTWANGNTGLVGVVSASNSLVGASSNDQLGSSGVMPLANGNYVIVSYAWKNGSDEFVGAATFVDAAGTRSGTIAISAANSLVGAHAHDGLGGMQVLPAADGNYAVYFPLATAPSGQTAGAAALASGQSGLSGTLNGSIAAYGNAAGLFSLDYDATHRQLIVGKTADDAVALLRLSGPAITVGGYLSGNWYDAAQAGHGFQLELATNNVMVAIWFVYTPDGSGQNWIYAQGTYDSTSNSVTLPAVLLTHAKFPPNFLPGDVQRTDWGSLTFNFADCNTATVTWNSTLPVYGVGSLPLTRLTQIAGTACPN